MISEKTRMRYVGRKFGMLEVLELTRRDPKNKNHYFLRCVCECGTEKEVRLSCLQQGTTVSCGCFGRAQTRTRSIGNTYNRGAYGENARSRILARYRRDAAKRGIQFQLSDDDFFDICGKPCFYCGSNPSSVFKPKNSYGEYVYSGVDRLDNGSGYTKENCVPACKSCNSLKNAITKEMIFKIYHRLFPET